MALVRHELPVPEAGEAAAPIKVFMSRPKDSQPTFVDAAWRRLVQLFTPGRRKAARPGRPKPSAKKAPGRTWVKFRRTLKLAFASRKPKAPKRRLWLKRELLKWRTRLSAFRATLSGRRYWLLVIAIVVVLTGSGFAAYKAWQHAQLRKETLATVNEMPITRADLFAEVIAVGADLKQLDAAARKQLLDRIIERRLLVGIAAKQGIANEPRTMAMRARSDELLLANLVAQRVAGAPPPPASDDDARKFMAANPAMFSERQTFVIDAMNCVLSSMPTNAETVFATMDDAERFLQDRKAPHRRSLQTLDSADLPPSTLAMLMKMKPNDVFVMPQGRMTLIGTVKRRLPSTIPPEIQLETARQIINRQQTEARLRTAIRELRSKAAIGYKPL